VEERVLYQEPGTLESVCSQYCHGLSRSFGKATTPPLDLCCSTNNTVGLLDLISIPSGNIQSSYNIPTYSVQGTTDRAMNNTWFWFPGSGCRLWRGTGEGHHLLLAPG
jgi:hypothetical protein